MPEGNRLLLPATYRRSVSSIVPVTQIRGANVRRFFSSRASVTRNVRDHGAGALLLTARNIFSTSTAGIGLWK
jgi:hypothetical protein